MHKPRGHSPDLSFLSVWSQEMQKIFNRPSLLSVNIHSIASFK